MFYTIQHIRNTIRWTRFIAGACLLPLLLAGCADSDDTSFDGEQEHSKLTLLLNVNCDTQFLSRAGESENPLGGQNGNGLRPGEHHENDIDNLCVFAFANTDDKNISLLPGTTELKEACYVSNVNFKPSLSQYINGKFTTEVSVDFKGSITSGDAFLVIANAGDVHSKLKEQVTGAITLDQVRNYLITSTVKRTDGNLSGYTLFTMANAANSENKGGDGSKKNPYKVSVNLERTTARVDFWYQPTLTADNKPANTPSAPLLGYKVVDKYNPDTQTGWMYISHIKLMNVAQYAPYALKRLGSNSSSSTYFAREEHVNDEAVQYVVEPNTWAKANQSDYSQLYGNTYIDYVSANYGQGIFTTREAVRDYSTPQIAPNENDGFNAGWSEDRETHEAYYVLDYVNENTIEKEYTTGKNTTSLLLKTKFVPKTLYYVDGTELKTKQAGYGDTFWAMEVKDGEQRYKLYFATNAAAELYRILNPTVTTANPVEYPGGDSYYTIWIRHDNNKNDALIGKMEYGIVRNNIYRIGVEKVLGPGSPAPVATENPEDVNLHIYVRKWNFMSVPTIYI